MNSVPTLKKSFKKLIETRKDIQVPAFMGNLQDVVKADENSNVYVVLQNGEVLTVRNTRVPNVNRLPVIVGYDVERPNVLQVLRARDIYIDPPFPEVPDHAGETHQWPKHDTLWVRGEQFLPGLVIPSTGLSVSFIGFVYYVNGWHEIRNQDIDFTSVIPTSGAKYVLVEVDEIGTVTLNSGAVVGGRELLVPENIPNPSAGKYPLFAVKVYIGQTGILKSGNYTDIMDLRLSGYAESAGMTLWSSIMGRPTEITENLSSQITGTATHFTLAHTATEKVKVWCGVRQHMTSYYMDDDDAGFTLSYAPTLFDSLLVEYKY
ncbi:MAG: hypothetical protein NTW69_06255 [Chloroflexi bacterium]|nr:hypothetical protein [Chloroflexota bacterium]